MSPPSIPSDSSRSAVVRASMHGEPSGASYTQSAIGSASTESSERVAASSRALRAASRSCPATSRCGTCRPNSVSVCAPSARSSGPRIDGSVSEWQ